MQDVNLLSQDQIEQVILDIIVKESGISFNKILKDPLIEQIGSVRLQEILDDYLKRGYFTYKDGEYYSYS